MATDSEMLLRILGKFEHVDERFDKIDAAQIETNMRLGRLESGQARIEGRLDRVEFRLGSVERKVDAIAEQTAHLLEFETEARERLGRLEAARAAAE
ncbi:MAG: hypothetical protein LBJ10_02380 [Clostridiales bacterium]|jgi:hypothetical protein|nr:hypothetical protein [Clostridiales bacterium]